MAIFGKDGFVRKQQIAAATKLLVWKYEKAGIPVPDKAFISAQAGKIVDDAHVIAKNTGRNVFEILKDRVKGLTKS